MTPGGLVRLAIAAALLLASCAVPVRAGDETCEPIPVTWYSPSGVAGCTLDGPTDGVSSWYSGTAAAANWCRWPFTTCGSAQVQSHRTGVVITIPIGSFCDCWWTTDRRLVDLTRTQVLALGEDPAAGLIAVTVTPLDGGSVPLPDTALGGTQ